MNVALDVYVVHETESNPSFKFLETPSSLVESMAALGFGVGEGEQDKDTTHVLRTQ